MACGVARAHARHQSAGCRRVFSLLKAQLWAVGGTRSRMRRNFTQAVAVCVLFCAVRSAPTRALSAIFPWCRCVLIDQVALVQVGVVLRADQIVTEGTASEGLGDSLLGL